MKLETVKTYKPEAEDLIRSLAHPGGGPFLLMSCDNGEYKTDFAKCKSLDEFLDHLLATDETRLYVQRPGGPLLEIFLVQGNEPGVLVNDYHCPASQDGADLDRIIGAHADEWQAKEQTMATGYYFNGKWHDVAPAKAYGTATVKEAGAWQAGPFQVLLAVPGESAQAIIGQGPRDLCDLIAAAINTSQD